MTTMRLESKVKVKNDNVTAMEFCTAITATRKEMIPMNNINSIAIPPKKRHGKAPCPHDITTV